MKKIGYENSAASCVYRASHLVRLNACQRHAVEPTQPATCEPLTDRDPRADMCMNPGCYARVCNRKGDEASYADMS